MSLDIIITNKSTLIKVMAENQAIALANVYPEHFLRYWPFVRESVSHRWNPLTKPSDAELWYFLWSAWTNGKANNRDAGDLRLHTAHHDATVMTLPVWCKHSIVSWNVYLWLSCGFARLYLVVELSMMTSSNGKIFRVTGPLCGEFTGLRWIHCTKASDAELWRFLWSASE